MPHLWDRTAPAGHRIYQVEVWDTRRLLKKAEKGPPGGSRPLSSVRHCQAWGQGAEQGRGAARKPKVMHLYPQKFRGETEGWRNAFSSRHCSSGLLETESGAEQLQNNCPRSEGGGGLEKSSRVQKRRGKICETQ